MKTLTSMLAFTAALSVLALPAQAYDRAANGATNETITVAYGDLNLSSQAGIDTLYARLRSAAKLVCSPREDIRNLPMHRDWRQCMQGAVDEAVTRLNLPALMRTHQAASGRGPDDRVVGAR